MHCMIFYTKRNLRLP